VRSWVSSTSADQSVTATTDTSSTPTGFTSGICTSGGMRSRFDWSLSWTLTMETPISSPTRKRIVTSAWPRPVAE
jgi:hypothetical protein